MATSAVQVARKRKKTIIREFPVDSPYRRRVLGSLTYRCNSCDFMSFKAKEAYDHHLKTAHFLEEKIHE